ncbi:MAG TPA: hypothetical protein VGR90_06135, partial [Acidimicrobiales bacterium]|nr:hypothetical protein [Acidimicrobiales bacterium]
MRTTITFDADTAAIVERIRRERGAGISEVVNDLVRAGAARPATRRPFSQRTTRLGRSLIDVSNVADALEAAETQ